MRITETAAIITGGASGLGEATARHFRNQGAQVTIFDRDTTRGGQSPKRLAQPSWKPM